MKLLSAKNLVFLNIMLLLACAKEVSSEEKRREESDRAFERLRSAVGVYDGYAAAGDGRGTPMTLGVAAKRNPSAGSDAPALEVTMQIGMFGGVLLTASDASYDWGSGILRAEFAKATGGAAAGVSGGAGNGGGLADTLEVTATLADGRVTDAKLSGPRTGVRELVLRPGAASLPVAQVNEFQFAIALQGERSDKIDAVLSMRREMIDQKAPQSSDLPLLPPLLGSIRFQTLADVPQQAESTLYDPLTGVIQLALNDASTLTLENVFAPVDSEELRLRSDDKVEMTGMLNVSSRRVGSVAASWTPRAASLTDGMVGLPPRLFVGTYQGASGGRLLRAIGKVDFLGPTLTNPREYGFPTFPAMRVTVYQCLNGQQFGARTFTARGFDYLRKVFQAYQSEGGSTADVFYAADWQQLDGYIYDVGIPLGDPTLASAQFQLRPVTNGQNPTCQQLSP